MEIYIKHYNGLSKRHVIQVLTMECYSAVEALGKLHFSGNTCHSPLIQLAKLVSLLCGRIVEGNYKILKAAASCCNISQ